ncbi:class I SAM-dependent methyltransferase [Methylacidiphilum caldifontis]|nr:class I SAM-dependent methyltransferase [Methylacidiphilum caldifontis]
MHKTLTQLYLEHEGKIAHKWISYLKFYDSVFLKFKNMPINLLEIGVQNGGSLEIWSQYFKKAAKIVGCDINSRCKELIFSDPRIRVIIGDASQEDTKKQIISESSTFNLIIDDGSHKSSDVIKNFALYFPYLENNGIYIVEDLHCSYWKEFEGGLYYPYTTVGFLKKLVDIIHHPYWGVAMKRDDLIRGFEKVYGIRIENESLCQIYKIEFVNSICMITKSAEEETSIGKPIVAGKVAQVIPGVKDSEGAVSFPDQKGNFWSNETNPDFVEEKLLQQLAEKEEEIEKIKNSFSWKITKPIRFFQKLLKNTTKYQ